MKINEIIRAKRREQGMTQEQAAAALGVSASAVHKWEKGSSYPDITLLPALARLLGVDLNTLLSFQEDLTPEEIGRFCNGLVQKVKEEGISAGFEMAMEKIREYPASDLLLYNTAATLEGALILYAPEERERYGERLETLYRRVAQAGSGPLRDQAQYMLASKMMERQDFAGAQSLLDCLPTQPPYDREAMQATLYRKQGKRSEAAKLLEGKLLHGANDCFNALLSLAEIALEEGERRFGGHVGGYRAAHSAALWAVRVFGICRAVSACGGAQGCKAVHHAPEKNAAFAGKAMEAFVFAALPSYRGAGKHSDSGADAGKAAGSAPGG